MTNSVTPSASPAPEDVLLDALRQFVARTGHSRVPRNHIEPVGGIDVALGEQVADLRASHTRSTLDTVTIAAVETVAADWLWDPWDVSFQTHVAALHQYAAREGHTDVPRNHREAIDGTTVTLGSWVHGRHHEYRRSELTDDQIEAIAAVPGWEWLYPPVLFDSGTVHDADTDLAPDTTPNTDNANLEHNPDDELDLAEWLARRSHLDISRPAPTAVDDNLDEMPDLAAWLFEHSETGHRAPTSHDEHDGAAPAPVSSLASPGPAPDSADVDSTLNTTLDEDLDVDLADWLGKRSRLDDYRNSLRDGGEVARQADREATLTELRRFAEREGHIDVPPDHWFVDCNGIERPLDDSIRTIQGDYRWGHLTPSQESELVDAFAAIPGWTWPPKAPAWRVALQPKNIDSWMTISALLVDPSPLNRNAKSLQDIGDALHITRERVRQKRNLLAEQLYLDDDIAAGADQLADLLTSGIEYRTLKDRVAGPSFWNGLDIDSIDHAAGLSADADWGLWALATIAVYAGKLLPAKPKGKPRPRPVTVWSETPFPEPADAGDEPTNIDEWRDWVIDPQTRWVGTGPKPTQWLTDNVPAGTTASYTDIKEAFHNQFCIDDAEWFERWTAALDSIRRIDDTLLGWSGTWTDRIVATLVHHGEPLTQAELVDRIDPNSGRSIPGALITANKIGERVIKTVEGRWALPHWEGVKQYMGARELLETIVAEHDGQISKRLLVRLAAERSRFSVVSLNMAATQATSLVDDDGFIRFRQPGELIRLDAPETSPYLFRRVDSTRPDCWSVLITVDHAAMRSGSPDAPQPLAGIFGMEDGEPRIIDCDGVDVSVSLNAYQLALHTSRGWRTAVNAVGANDGDVLVFTALGPGKAALELAPTVTADSDAVATIRALIGGHGIDYLLEDLAYAVGVVDTPQSPDLLDVDALQQRLKERHGKNMSDRHGPVRELRNALQNIYPWMKFN